MGYTVLSSSEDEDAWHADRATVITASEMGELANGGAGAWVRIKGEKAGLSPRFGGNRATQWGHDRESIIMESLHERHGIEPNSHLLVSEEHPLHGGTPDGVHPAGALLGEAKTHNGPHLLEPMPKWATQAQWNMHVTGAVQVVLAVEYYDEMLPGEFRTRDFSRPQEFLIDRDDEEIARLMVLADRFFGMAEPTPDDLLLARAVEAKQAIKDAQTEWASVEAEILDRVGEAQKFNHVHPELGSMSFSRPQPRAQFLKEKFEESYPDLAEQFTVEGRVPKPTVRVTPLKEKK